MKYSVGIPKCSACGCEGIHACMGCQEDVLRVSVAIREKPSTHCGDCSGEIVYDKSIMLTSMPPKYRGDCVGCGKVYYSSIGVYND